MLFVHEVHKVVGKRAAEFEDAYRTEWLPVLAAEGDARLLWYFDLAHGSGLSYRAVTVTAVANGAAWERLAERVAHGDLRPWGRRLDGLQHESCGRVMTALGWSPPIGSLEEVPTEPSEHEATMYMEDTMWTLPGKLHDYIDAAGAIYQPTIHADDSQVKLKIVLALQTMPGAGRAPEVTLLQRISSLAPLIHLLTNDLPDQVTKPGSWMHDALELRDQWRSQLLRAAPWSPLP